MSQLIHSILPDPRREIVYITPDLTVFECVNLMISRDIGALVVHDGASLAGMVTERDIVRSSLNPGWDIKKTTAGEIAFVDVSILNINEPLEKAMATITRTKRRHILIEENNQLVALLSIGDLVYHLLEDKSRVIEHLENYIHS